MKQKNPNNLIEGVLNKHGIELKSNTNSSGALVKNETKSLNDLMEEVLNKHGIELKSKTNSSGAMVKNETKSLNDLMEEVSKTEGTRDIVEVDSKTNSTQEIGEVEIKSKTNASRTEISLDDLKEKDVKTEITRYIQEGDSNDDAPKHPHEMPEFIFQNSLRLERGFKRLTSLPEETDSISDEEIPERQNYPGNFQSSILSSHTINENTLNKDKLTEVKENVDFTIFFTLAIEISKEMILSNGHTLLYGITVLLLGLYFALLAQFPF